MKQKLEQGDAAPTTPVKVKSAPVTPKKTPSKATFKTSDEFTPSKRKRSPAKKVIDTTEDEEEGEIKATPKRAKSTPKAKPRPKHGFRTSDKKETVKTGIVVKGEPHEDDDVFADALEQPTADLKVEEVCKFSIPSLSCTYSG